MRRRSKPADRLANIFRTIVFFIVIGETAALAYILTRPKPASRSEFLVEPGRNHSLLIDDERFPIPVQPGQKIILTVENPDEPPPPSPESKPVPPSATTPTETSAPKEPRFRFYYDEPSELKWFRLEQRLDDLRGRDDWNTVLNVVKWSREQFEPGVSSATTTQNAMRMLRQIRAGRQDGGPLQMAELAVQAMQALGGRARHVSLAGHEVVEVWVPSHRRWIVVDPTNAVHFEDAKGRKLSALEVARRQNEARPVPATEVPTAQPSAYRLLSYWLRNDLFTRTFSLYDIDRWRVRAVLDSSELAGLSAGDLYTFFPEELYAAPPRERDATTPT